MRNGRTNRHLDFPLGHPPSSDAYTFEYAHCFCFFYRGDIRFNVFQKLVFASKHIRVCYKGDVRFNVSQNFTCLCKQAPPGLYIQGWLFSSHRSLRCHTERTSKGTFLSHKQHNVRVYTLHKQHNVRVYTYSTTCGYALRSFYSMTTC